MLEGKVSLSLLSPLSSLVLSLSIQVDNKSVTKISKIHSYFSNNSKFSSEAKKKKLLTNYNSAGI